MVHKKIKIFNFFKRAQKRSNFSENDIDIYLRLFLKYGAKLSSQKKVISVQSWGVVFLAGDFGICTLCMHEKTGTSMN